MSTNQNPGSDANMQPRDPNQLSDVNARPVNETEIAYRNGHVDGREISEANKYEREISEANKYEREREAEGNGLASGVVVGGILSLLMGLGAVTWAYTNRSVSPASPTQIVLPASPKPSASPVAPINKTTVIERTIEKPAPPSEIKVIEVEKRVPVPVMAAPSTAPVAPDRPASSAPTPASPTSKVPSTSQSSSTQPNSDNVNPADSDSKSEAR